MIDEGRQLIDPKTGDLHRLTPGLVIGLSRWTWARTKDHEYTVRDLADPDARRSTCLSHDSFEWMVHYVREHGEEAKWQGRKYVYFELGKHRYWSMGAPSEITTILNRAQL